MYSAVIRDLLAEDRLMPLGPGAPNRGVHGALSRLTVAAAFAPDPVRNENAARACLAALWLWHDFLDESHKISQDVGSMEGSYWHAIMHRREPDYGNSKYWFRRVGRHPVFEPLAQEAAQMDARIFGPAWDPFAFVDWCERAAAGDAALERVCREVQRAEWRLLFDFCYRAAV